MKKNERGITLIALVVTIVVLLILAGVSISMLTGENGIITQANKANEENAHSSIYEALQLETADYNLEKQQGKDVGDLIDFIKGKNKIDGNSVVNVKELVGKSISFGNGNITDGDYYKIEETIEENGQIQYKVVYYGNKNTVEWEKELIEIETKQSIGILANVVKVGDYVNYAPTYTNPEDIKEGIGNGWRVAYVENSSGVVTLVSEGVPLSTYLNNPYQGNCQAINFDYEELNNFLDDTVANNIDLLALEDIQLLCTQANYVLTHTEAGKISQWQYVDEKYTVDNDSINIFNIETDYLLNTIGADGYGNDHYLWSNGYDSSFSAKDTSENIGVRLVIDLKSNLEYYGGDGKQENPYQIY